MKDDGPGPTLPGKSFRAGECMQSLPTEDTRGGSFDLTIRLPCGRIPARNQPYNAAGSAGLFVAHEPPFKRAAVPRKEDASGNQHSTAP